MEPSGCLLVSGNSHAAVGRVLVYMIRGLEQVAGLASLGIELEPLFVGREADVLGSDAALFEPPTDSVHAMRRRSEKLDNLLGGVPLAVLGGIMARSEGLLLRLFFA